MVLPEQGESGMNEAARTVLVTVIRVAAEWAYRVSAVMTRSSGIYERFTACNFNLLQRLSRLRYGLVIGVPRSPGSLRRPTTRPSARAVATLYLPAPWVAV
jgi:hypothetical protein